MLYKNFLCKLFLLIFILSSFLGILGSFLLEKEKKYLAKVNEEYIPYSDYLKVKNFFEKENKTFHTKGETSKEYIHLESINQLINESLLRQFAKKNGIQASNEEVEKKVFSEEIFLENKVFSKSKFFDFLNRINLSIEEYYKIVENRIIFEKLEKMIEIFSYLLPKEIENLKKIFFQKRIATFLEISNNKEIDEQIVEKKEILSFYNTNKEDFFVPEKFFVEYVEVNLNDIRKKIEILDKEVLKWYEENKKNFYTSERKLYNIIEFKEKEEFKKISEKIRKRNFLDLENYYKIYNLDTENEVIEKKEDQNWIKFVEQSNLKKEGEISKIFYLDKKYYIIFLKKITPSYYVSFNKVKEKIIKFLKEEKSKKEYEKIKKKILEIVFKNSINEEEKNYISLYSKKSNWFDSRNFPIDISNYRIKEFILEKLFFQKNQLPFLNQEKEKLQVLTKVNFERKKLLSIDSVSNIIENKIKRKKFIEKNQKKSEKILENFDNNRSFLESIKKEYKNKLYRKEFEFSEKYYDPIANSVFSIPLLKEKNSYTFSYDKNDNYFLIVLEKIKYRDIDEREEKIFIEKMNKNMHNIYMKVLLSNLRNSAKIKFFKN
ncbi:SurA N-terminal domain-containing protein [bacterium endosymbiont of Pedicinus badii]|uniref:SurA N-terminal domain-containing protein n=1 Tax=bacterium endosymbiont of Pedicinus badii TaxID=1719126 RepID=UPI0009BA94A0|nr:SurA N-terminal domain-containing protein [bacterium endosymbiont of Pedicinus badii]OQM34295.1 hypothetical protein AOQ89_00125 [bacterium endosymbiont of Pedicinus badii]